jgi:hypothetical protein
MGQESNADGPHSLMMGGHDNLRVQGIDQGLNYTFIEGHTPLKHYRGYNIPAQAHIVQIIAHQGLTQAPEDIIQTMPHLLLVHHIRFGEDRAPPADAHRGPALKGAEAYLLDPYVEPQGLMVQKTSSARCAHSVHAKIRDRPFP